MNDKISLGQFYTKRSPFDNALFRSWASAIPDGSDFVEPFAGGNDLIRLVSPLLPNVSIEQWHAYDLDPGRVGENLIPDVEIVRNDSIRNTPSGDVAITNPPYLARNSASRRGIHVDFEGFSDLWELSIHQLLENFDFVAAIIPESFLTRDLFRERLFGVSSITLNIFDDTDFPVCLALWTNRKSKDFTIYIGNERIGTESEIRAREPILSTSIDKTLNIRYNDPNGILGLRAIDNTSTATIRYVRGEEIDSSKIKVSSRAFSRISIERNGRSLINEDNLDEIIIELNTLISQYRNNTRDVFLTSFKGLRKDGVYRRRMDWMTSSLFIHHLFGKRENSLFDTSL